MSRNESNHLSAEDMRVWLLDETRNVLKEAELRVREATEFTTAYAMGKLSPAQAHERMRKYDARWGEALEGVYASSFKSDDAILKAIDEQHAAAHATRRKYEKILERGEKGRSERGR